MIKISSFDGWLSPQGKKTPPFHIYQMHWSDFGSKRQFLLSVSIRCLYEKIYFLLSESFLLGIKDQFCYPHQRDYTFCLERQILIFFYLIFIEDNKQRCKILTNLEIKSNVWYILTRAQSNDSENCVKSKN